MFLCCLSVCLPVSSVCSCVRAGVHVRSPYLSPLVVSFVCLCMSALHTSTLCLCVCASQIYSVSDDASGASQKVCLSVQELQMWKVLSFDKNLVQFYGSCEQDGKVLLVLEYMEVQLLSVITQSVVPCLPPCCSLYELHVSPRYIELFSGISESRSPVWG